MQRPNTNKIRDGLCSPVRANEAALATEAYRLAAIIESLCDYIDQHECETWIGVSPMQIREFVARGPIGTGGDPHVFRSQILDFIDNGPKTAAETIAATAIGNSESRCDTAANVVAALREAGLLKEGV